jgi:transcriptional regulator with XRE-family HTH domain
MPGFVPAEDCSRGRIREAMRLRGIRGADLARALHLDQSYLSRVARGLVAPSLAQAARLAVALDVSVDYLAGLTDRPEAVTCRRPTVGRRKKVKGGA